MASLSPQPHFVVTGPTGWIGQALLATLAKRFGGRLNGRVTAFASSARVMELPWGEALDIRALDSIEAEDVAGAHIFHLAYLTKEKVSELGEDAFVATNLAIDEALLKAMTAAPASLFVASSGAASLAAKGIDRHPYGVAKLEQEARFLSFAAAHAVPTIAGRIFNVAGPWINKIEAYALSNFAAQALKGHDISIAADRPVFRSFLHVEDLCELMVEAALQGTSRAEPIDFCGAEVLEMQDIAQAVAQACGASGAILRPAIHFAQPAVYLGNHVNTRVLAMELGLSLAPFTQQVADTVAWMMRDPAIQPAIEQRQAEAIIAADHTPNEHS